MIMPKRILSSIAVYSIGLVTVTTKTPLLRLVRAADTAADGGYLCELVDCANGMFNQAKCACDCIPPFCPDVNGDCIVSGTCDDPWADCEVGNNCPWWENTSQAESCDTGPLVPAGTWDIFPTEEICCQAKFPYSTSCNIPPETSPPTKYPTLAYIENDEEIIPIQFSVSGVHGNDGGVVPIPEISDEMEIVLKRILLRLAEQIDGLKIKKVVAIDSSSRRKTLRRELLPLEEGKILLYFHIYVVRSDDKDFGPYIILGIRDSYSEVISEIETFSDTDLFTGDLNVNFCIQRNGSYDLCAVDEASTKSGPTSDGQNEEEGQQLLAGWAIALIILFVLSLVGCGGYAIAVLYFGVTNCFQRQDKGGKGKEVQNNIYMDGIGSRGPIDYERRLAIMDDRSRKSGKSRKEFQNNSYVDGNGSLGPIDYERRLAIMDDRSRKSEKSIALTQHDESRTSWGGTLFCEDPLEDSSSFHDSFTINSYRRSSRQPRDPTMYIPGQEDRPDPTESHHSSFRTTGIHGSRRHYSEEPPVKPKRDPTMYVNGKKASVEHHLPTKYVEEQGASVMHNDEYSDGDDNDEDYNEYYRGESGGRGGTNSKKPYQYGRSEDEHPTHFRSQYDRYSSASRSQFSSHKSRRSTISNQQNSIFSD